MLQSPIPRQFCLLLLSLALMTGCIKTSSLNPSSDDEDDSPVTTPQGSPNGTSITKTIGASGGSLVSPDGKFTVTIPAGALNNNTDITIQPITNEAPGGIGNGYDLLPNGTSFNTPVTLTYHYTDDDINGSSPYFLYIATQDSTGAWTENAYDRDLDTTGNTISITTPHFSSYVPVSSLRLEFGQTDFFDGESNYIKVMQTLTKKDVAILGDDEGDPVGIRTISVHKNQQVPDNEVSHWSLNGMGPTTADYGTITGTGSNVTYTAPNPIPEEETVQVTVQVNGTFVAYVKGKKVTFNQVTLFGHVNLIRKYSFDVKIEMHATGTNSCFLDDYKDEATMHVDVDRNDAVTISNIQNQPPTVSPTSGSDDEFTCTWVPDQTGLVNIVKASGTVSPTGNVPSGIRKAAFITINSDGQGSYTLSGYLPKWTVTDPYGYYETEGGISLPSFPPAVNIVLRDSIQTASVSSPIVAGIEADGTITITPIH